MILEGDSLQPPKVGGGKRKTVGWRAQKKVEAVVWQ